MANRYLLFRFDWLGALFLFVVTTGAIYSNASQGFVAIILVAAVRIATTDAADMLTGC
jgi:hypothetical protein